MPGNEDISELERCRERALKLLSQKPHTVRQLRIKLLRKEFSKKHTDEVITDFLRVGLLDDRRVAYDYCSYMKTASPPVGRNRIKAKLYHYGVPAEIISEALEDNWDEDGDDGEVERAVHAARRKLRLIRDQSDPWKVREKLYRFLAGKGFSGSVCSQAVNRLEDVS